MWQKLFSSRQKSHSYFETRIIRKHANHSYFMILLIWCFENILKCLEKAKHQSCHGAKSPRAVKRYQIVCHRPGLMYKSHAPFLNFKYIYLDPILRGINADVQWVYWILVHLCKVLITKSRKTYPSCPHLEVTMQGYRQRSCVLGDRSAQPVVKQGSGKSKDQTPVSRLL